MKALVLRVAKVPAEPQAPAGSAGSVRVFRAAPNYWKYQLVLWGIRQASAAFFIFLFLGWTSAWLDSVTRRANAPPPPPKAAAPVAGAEAKPAEPPKKTRRQRGRDMTLKTEKTLANVLHALELFGLGTFLLQVPFSLAVARLDYEMRWYIVTDRSLRIREGIFGVREMTLTFANVQNIAIHQGPLQRLLGIADVVVRTAGGGAGDEQSHGNAGSAGSSMHIGKLRAVDNAEAVRDLVLERLRRFRDAGLGDPDDRHHRSEIGEASVSGVDALRAAARELLEAARALRGA